MSNRAKQELKRKKLKKQISRAKQEFKENPWLLTVARITDEYLTVPQKKALNHFYSGHSKNV